MIDGDERRERTIPLREIIKTLDVLAMFARQQMESISRRENTPLANYFVINAEPFAADRVVIDEAWCRAAANRLRAIAEATGA